MLILSRKLEEAIWLGDNIKVKIMGIEKGTVKIGIEAPSDITILREELKEAVAD
ncbi:carbon storage regulator CsrA, partial [Campylobacterota bacterium]